MKLTKAAVARLVLPAGVDDRIFFDDDLPGFGLRLRGGGKRTWVVQYRVGTKQRRVNLGNAEALDPEEARKSAKAMLSKATLGVDPQAERAEARAQASVTLGSVADDYLTRFALPRLKPRSFEEVERHLRKHWSGLTAVPLMKVTRADVAAQLAKIAKDSGPVAANRARASLSGLFAWAIGEGLADGNPVIGTNKACEEAARDHVLTDGELALVWRCAGSGDYGAIVKLLLLTGQRREEVAAMTWAEVDLEGATWNIGAERTKNHRAHDVPLSEAALAILKAVVRREGRELVFGEGAGGFQGWSNAKTALDKRIAQVVGCPPPPWRLHDLRRTVATRMADMGVQPHIIEAVLNHASGHKAGVAGIYNRSTYATEKRDALSIWSRHVISLVEGS